MFTTALLIPGSEPGIAASDESQSKLLYFRTLHVNPIKANVSFATDALRDDKKEVRLLLLLFFFFFTPSPSYKNYFLLTWHRKT